jgi:hypothetical protein
MSQLFAAVYEVTSAVVGRPSLRLNLIVNGDTDSVVGTAVLETYTGDVSEIAVRGHCMEIEGEQPVKAIVLAGTPQMFGLLNDDPSAFQLLLLLPTAWKDGQACYKMSFGKLHPRVIEVRDGVARAVLPEYTSG